MTASSRFSKRVLLQDFFEVLVMMSVVSLTPCVIEYMNMLNIITTYVVPRNHSVKIYKHSFEEKASELLRNLKYFLNIDNRCVDHE